MLYLAFQIKDGNERSLIFQQQENGKLNLPNTVIQEQDAFATSIAGARIVIDELNELDLRELSLITDGDRSAVDETAYQKIKSEVWAHAEPEEKVKSSMHWIFLYFRNFLITQEITRTIIGQGSSTPAPYGTMMTNKSFFIWSISPQEI